MNWQSRAPALKCTTMVRAMHQSMVHIKNVRVVHQGTLHNKCGAHQVIAKVVHLGMVDTHTHAHTHAHTHTHTRTHTHSGPKGRLEGSGLKDGASSPCADAQSLGQAGLPSTHIGLGAGAGDGAQLPSRSAGAPYA